MPPKSLLFAALLLIPTYAFANSNEVEMGRERAIESCSGCHQVTAQQPQPSPVPFPEENALVVPPSFEAISLKYDGHEEELRAFVLAPDHPMKEQQFLPIDLNAIIAYIKKAKDWWLRPTR